MTTSSDLSLVETQLYALDANLTKVGQVQGISINIRNTKADRSTVFLAQNSLRPNILKVLPQSITGAPSVGMGKCEWGKVEFSNFRRGPPG